jgi:hypothetical protein
MHSRFSLRTLLLLTALAAAACYWWVARPTIVANRFVAAINHGATYDAADALFPKDEVTVSARHLDWLFNLSKMGINAEPGELEMNAYVFPRTWNDLIDGQRRVHVDVKNVLETGWDYIATPRHMKNATFGLNLLPPDLPLNSNASSVDD